MSSSVQGHLLGSNRKLSAKVPMSQPTRKRTHAVQQIHRNVATCLLFRASRSHRLRPGPLRHVCLGRHRSFGATMTDHEQALRAARHSLRNVVSIRDFLLAVQVGSETAVAMLDKVESKILEVLETLNEDLER
jgi:hypothetical protein